VTLVTDEALRELVAMKSLKSLDLRQTRVTAAGMKEFRKARPGCEIIK